MASLTALRQRNRAAVLSAIAHAGPLSRSELGRRLGLAGGTVSGLTAELMEEGLLTVAETTSGAVPGRSGRPRELLGLARDLEAWGIRVRAHRVTAVRVNLRGDTLDTLDLPYDAAAPDAVARLGKLLLTLLEDRLSRTLGVGIAVSGPVEDPSGRVLRSPALGWQDVPLADELRGRLGVPVAVTNDVDALATAQSLYGDGRAYRSFVTLTLGVGIGMAVVVDREVRRGPAGSAGEVGHVQVDPDGPPCRCGSNGCLEACASDAAILFRARELGLLPSQSDATDADATDSFDTVVDNPADEREIARLAGMPEAAALFAEAGATIGRVLHAVVNVLAPEAVIVSGEGVRRFELIAPALESALRVGVLGASRSVPLVVDDWDGYAWARGAAASVLHLPFRDGGLNLASDA